MSRAFWPPMMPLLLLLLAGGCNSGPRLERIWGTVTFDGKPLDSGTIELAPVNDTGGPSTGAPIAAGSFEIAAKKGVRAGGVYKVVITATKSSGKTVPNIFQPGGPPLDIGEQFIPARYNTESTLTITVSADAAKNEHHFELQAGR